MNLGKTTIKVAKNTLIQSGGKFISSGLGFVTVVFLTRYLGANGYGNFSIVFSYLAFFSILSDFGMQLAIVRELSGAQGESLSLYGTYFWLKLLTVVGSDLGALLVLFFFPYSIQLKLAIVIGILAVSLSGMMGYFNAIFQARIRLDLITLIDVITKFSTVFLIVIFIFLKLNFYFIVSTVLIGNLVGFVFALSILKDTITLKFDSALAKKIALLSIPIGITSFISTLYFKVDTIILSLYKSSGDVGIYSLAYKILENVIVFWGFYMASTYPVMAKFKYENNKKYFYVFKSSIIVSILSSIPLVLILFILAPFVIDIFGGKGFQGAVLSLRILLFSLPALFLNGLFYNFYVIERKNIVTTIAMTISLIANIWMNILYIPKYGYVAASYTTVISALLLLLCYIVGMKFHRRVREL